MPHTKERTLQPAKHLFFPMTSCSRLTTNQRYELLTLHTAMQTICSKIQMATPSHQVKSETLPPNTFYTYVAQQNVKILKALKTPKVHDAYVHCSNLNTNISSMDDLTQGSHSFTDKKSRTFPGLSRTPHEKFSRTFSEPTNS